MNSSACSPETAFSRIWPELLYTLPPAAPKALAMSQNSGTFRWAAVWYRKPVPDFSGSNVPTFPRSSARRSRSIASNAACVFGTAVSGIRVLLNSTAAGSTVVP